MATAPSRLLGVFGAVPRYDSGDMGADAEIPSMNWAQMQPELAPVETRVWALLEERGIWRLAPSKVVLFSNCAQLIIILTFVAAR